MQWSRNMVYSHFTLCLRAHDYIKRLSQHPWYGFWMRVKDPHHYKVTALDSCVKWPSYDHEMNTRIFTLIMSKIFIRATEIMSMAATPLIWNCSYQSSGSYSRRLGKRLVGKGNHLRPHLPYVRLLKACPLECSADAICMGNNEERRILL